MTLVDIAVVLGSLGIPGAIAWLVHKLWPRMRAKRERERAKDFAILGGPIRDPLSGKVLAVQPPLGQWMSGIKDDISNLSTIVARQAEQNDRISANTADVSELKVRVKTLEEDRTERIVTRAESAQMWRAVAENTIDDGPTPA